MRERHWKDLMKVVKTDFTLPADNPDMRLRDLMNMNLHQYGEGTKRMIVEIAHALSTPTLSYRSSHTHLLDLLSIHPSYPHRTPCQYFSPTHLTP